MISVFHQGTHWTPSKMIHRLGKEINNPDSVYYWAYKVAFELNTYKSPSPPSFLKFESLNDTFRMTSQCLVPPSLTAHWVIWSISTHIRTPAWCLTLWRVSRSRCEISAMWRLFDSGIYDHFAYFRYSAFEQQGGVC